MKHLRLMAIGLSLAIANSASAQFTNASSTSTTTSTEIADWSTISVEWNPSTFRYDSKSMDNESFTGFSFQYTYAAGLSKKFPIFVEAGLGFQFSFDSESLAESMGIDDDDLEYFDPYQKMLLFSMKVPVNIMYNFQIPNTKVQLIPFLGINLRFNLAGIDKLDMNLTDAAKKILKEDYGSKWEKEATIYGYPAGGYSNDVFDKKDMGKDYTWNRFQIGWHIGLKARFNERFLIGASYGTDFMEISKKTKIGTASVMLGYTF